MATIEIIFPVFAIIGLGYLLRHIGLIRPGWAHILNTFVYYVSLPSLIATSFWRIDWASPDMLSLLGFQVAVLVAFVALLWLLVHFFGPRGKMRTVMVMLASLGNTVYIGFPLGLIIFGQAGAAALVSAGTVQLLAGIVLSFFLIEVTVLRTRNWHVYLRDLSRNPLILSMLVGIIFRLTVSQAVTPYIARPLDGLAATASPLALFALGAFIHGRYVRAHFSASLLSSILKLACFPLFVFAAGKLWGLSDEMLSISLLVAAMPTAATSFVLAEKYALEESLVANTIFLSTILSAVTLSLILRFALS